MSRFLNFWHGMAAFATYILLLKVYILLLKVVTENGCSRSIIDNISLCPELNYEFNDNSFNIWDKAVVKEW
jgi:hypothetical protein